MGASYELSFPRMCMTYSGFRLMPDKYTTNQCPNCKKDVETEGHRYATCDWVASLWAWLADILGKVDQDLAQVQVQDLLKFHFAKGRMDAAVTWILASYVSIINQEVVIKGRKLRVCELAGIMRYFKSKLRHEAVQDVGFIPL